MRTWIQDHRFRLCIAGLIILYCISVLWNLGYLGLRIEEARRTIISLEMMETGNYIQPHTLGWPYYNKPPVFNWVLAGIIGLFQSDTPFIVRLPSLISLLLLGLVHYRVAVRFLPNNIALLSSLFVITAGDLYFYTLSNGAEIDVFYSLVVYLQVISIFYFFVKNKPTLLFIISWSLCAVGFLTKGFTSLGFQVLTLAAISVYARSWKTAFTWRQVPGIMLFLAITGGYYFLYSRHDDPAIAITALFNESMNKSVIGAESEGRLYRIFKYPLVLLRVLSPWCLLIFLWFKKPRPSLWENPFIRFSILFIVFNIGVYWFTGAQKTRYIIMFLPFFMTIISYVFFYWENRSPMLVKNYLRMGGVLFLIVAISVLCLPVFFATAWWKSFVFTLVTGLFLYLFNRLHTCRIWLCVLGIVLTRIAYSWIGIPLKSEGETDFKSLAHRFAAINEYRAVHYWGRPDTLRFKFDPGFNNSSQPVPVVPWFIRYQVPYYLQHYTDTLPKFDTVMRPEHAYITFMPYIDSGKVVILDYFYDRHFDDYLVLCKGKQ